MKMQVIRTFNICLTIAAAWTGVEVEAHSNLNFGRVAFFVRDLLVGKGFSAAIEEFLQNNRVALSVNEGCPEFPECSSTNGSVGVTIANVTVFPDPVESRQPDQGVGKANYNRWIWGIMDHPVVQAAVTEPDSELQISWNELFRLEVGDRSGAIRFQKPPAYSAAIMLTKIIEFNDTALTGKVEDVASPEDMVEYLFEHFKWQRLILEKSNETVVAQFIGFNYTDPSGKTSVNGTVNITISGYSREGFADWLPHLSVSQNLNQVDVQLMGLNSTAGFNCTRFALEAVIVSRTSFSPRSEADLETERQSVSTLDDEHTPGIFSTENLIMPGEGGASYLQWRPVSYSTIQRELSDSTGMSASNASRVHNASVALNNTMLYVLYGTELDKALVRSINFSLGTPGDGFYNKTAYLSWTFSLGLGEPVKDGFSAYIILTITLMFLFMAITLMVSAIICAKHHKEKRAKEAAATPQQEQPTSSSTCPLHPDEDRVVAEEDANAEVVAVSHRGRYQRLAEES